MHPSGRWLIYQADASVGSLISKAYLTFPDITLYPTPPITLPCICPNLVWSHPYRLAYPISLHLGPTSSRLTCIAQFQILCGRPLQEHSLLYKQALTRDLRRLSHITGCLLTRDLRRILSQHAAGHTARLRRLNRAIPPANSRRAAAAVPMTAVVTKLPPASTFSLSMRVNTVR